MKFDEKTIAKQRVYNGIIVNVDVDDAYLEALDLTVKREVVHHPGGVCIACLKADGTFAMVSQFRYAIGQNSLEFVAGKLEVGEDPLLAAQRELAEEAGLMAETWVSLGHLYPSPAYLTEKVSLYFATNTVQVNTMWDEDEQLVLHAYTLPEIFKLIDEHKITNTISVSLAYQVDRYLRQEHK